MLKVIASQAITILYQPVLNKDGKYFIFPGNLPAKTIVLRQQSSHQPGNKTHCE